MADTDVGVMDAPAVDTGATSDSSGATVVLAPAIVGQTKPPNRLNQRGNQHKMVVVLKLPTVLTSVT